LFHSEDRKVGIDRKHSRVVKESRIRIKKVNYNTLSDLKMLDGGSLAGFLSN